MVQINIDNTVIISIISILSSIGGGLVVFFGKFGEGWINSYFEKIERKAKHKRNVAREVHKLCIEASTGNYRIPPRNREHVNSVLVDVESVDNRISLVMDSFISLWRELVDQLKKDRQYDGQAEYEYVKELLNKVEAKRKILVAWENKLRAG